MEALQYSIKFQQTLYKRNFSYFSLRYFEVKKFGAQTIMHENMSTSKLVSYTRN